MKFALMFGVIAISFSLNLPASASPFLDGYAQEAQGQFSTFDGFSSVRGKTLFLNNYASGKPETPACTSCHTKSPTQAGQTRAGKVIAAMATSISPERYSDKDKVEKWFRRNCNSVLGRLCTPLEKGDFITFMKTQ